MEADIANIERFLIECGWCGNDRVHTVTIVEIAGRGNAMSTMEELGIPRRMREYSTLADLLHDLGDIHPNRIWMNPAPGTVTLKSFIESHIGMDKPIREMVLGTVVEKALGFYQSVMSVIVASPMLRHVLDNRLGYVIGAGGLFLVNPTTARSADIAYIAKNRVPITGLPSSYDDPVPAIIPNLTVDMIKRDNTLRELEMRRKDYFQAGVMLHWEIDAEDRTAMVYTDWDIGTPIAQDGMLDGGKILPGFNISLREIFSEADGDYLYEKEVDS